MLVAISITVACYPLAAVAFELDVELTMVGVSGLLFITSLRAACITVILSLYLQLAEEISYLH